MAGVAGSGDCRGGRGIDEVRRVVEHSAPALLLGESVVKQLAPDFAVAASEARPRRVCGTPRV
jgi:hypothetical protein